MIGRNDPCWCSSGKKWKKCHYPRLDPNSSNNNLKQKYEKQFQIILKTEREIEGIRKSGHLAAKILTETCKMAKAGVTTQELNDFAHKLHEEAGAIPATLGYGSPPFTRSICTSLNDVICHGIPDQTVLKDGDVLNIDVTCILNGYYGDCSRMVAIGKIDPDKQLVMDVSYECLMRSIAILKPNILLSEIGDVIEDYATEKNCSVVHQFVAHGVGIDFHEAPQIPHFRNNLQIPLAPGMTFTIEPMINAGAPEGYIDPNDKWTARTRDGKASGQWEHTLLITQDGHEILTPWKR